MRSVSGGARADGRGLQLLGYCHYQEQQQHRPMEENGDSDDDGGGCRGDGAAWDPMGLETSSSGRSCYDTVAASGTW